MSGVGARWIDAASEARRRSSIQASTSARSQTTHRDVRKKRRGLLRVAQFMDGRVGPTARSLRNSGRRTVRLKSKGDDGMNPWIQPRPSNGASFASRNTSLAGVGVFLFVMQSSSTPLRSTQSCDLAKRHQGMCVRRSDTHSEEMRQSDLSRRIPHGGSGYPVAAILDPFCRLAGLPQRRPL